MNYGEFKSLVDSFINKRGLSAQIPQFIEMAKLELLRKHDFAFTIAETVVSYPSAPNTGVALPSNLKSLQGEYPVKLVLSSGDLPLRATTLERELARVSRTTSVTYTNAQIANILSTSSSITKGPLRFYIKPSATLSQLFTIPEQLEASLKVSYYRYLAPYTNDSDSDFLLSYGYDLLLFETLKVANTYIFEEDRIPLDATVASDKLADFIRLDGRLETSNAPIDVS